jgi:hypothetical protein
MPTSSELCIQALRRSTSDLGRAISLLARVRSPLPPGARRLSPPKFARFSYCAQILLAGLPSRGSLASVRLSSDEAGWIPLI